MQTEPHTLQCFEVWGGNDAVDRAVSVPGLDAWVLSKPHAGDALGGDIHYLSSCATGRIGRVLLADVSGHGLRVSEIAIRLRELMRRYINFVDHTRLVRTLNEEFAAIATPGMFATAAVITWWAPAGELDITSAGHPPALIYRHAAGTWSTLEMPEAAPLMPHEASELHDAPLGVLSTTQYQRMQVQLAPGDMVLLYSDALIEATRPAAAPTTARDELGIAGLLAAANAEAQSPPGEFVARLFARVHGACQVDDDVTLLLLRRSETTVEKSGPAQGLLASFRIAREALRDWTRGKAAALPEARTDNILGAWVDRLNRRK